MINVRKVKVKRATARFREIEGKRGRVGERDLRGWGDEKGWLLMFTKMNVKNSLVYCIGMLSPFVSQ